MKLKGLPWEYNISNAKKLIEQLKEMKNTSSTDQKEILDEAIEAIEEDMQLDVALSQGE